MSKISKKLAQAIQQELVKFDGTPEDFMKAVQAAASDKQAAKTTVDLAHQFIILGTYFHKLAGQPLSDNPNYGTEFSVSVGGNTLVSGSLGDGTLVVSTNGNLEFMAAGNKAAHIIKKWEARIGVLRRAELRHHKEKLKELGKMLPKKTKGDFKAAKAKAINKLTKPNGAAPVDDNEGW